MSEWKQDALRASRSLNLMSEELINKVLLALADEILLNSEQILLENAKDLAQMERSNPLYDRLLLNRERLDMIAEDVRTVAALDFPQGKVLMNLQGAEGIAITKITVPFGVIGVIYEARPNVSFDVFSLCFKSGNACVLKGGSAAQHSNAAIVALIRSLLLRFDLDKNIISLLAKDRETTTDLLNAVGYVDLIIPRGGKGLIDFVRNNSRIPVIETGAGICHTYIDEEVDVCKAEKIVFNAKTRRVSVCNALDCVLVHEKQLPNLSAICKKLADKQVLIYADAKAYTFLSGFYPQHLLQRANEESYGTEFLDYKLSVKTVQNIVEAVEHISLYSSKHSECIVSENRENIVFFDKMVDAACVYTNVSTAFTDGAQFGLGAEIGISTQKLHARGPMALAALCSYKWIIKGNGQIRE